MPRVCGIELKSSEAILTIVDDVGGDPEYLDIKSTKIKISDDESSAEVQAFFDVFVNFIRNNKIDVIVLKKRAKRGRMAGGAVSFKLEGLIQLNGVADVVFVSGQGIAAANKKEPFEIPKSLNRYQDTAFMAACLYIRKL